MSLSNINFKNYYSGSMGHNLLDLLYTPCLKNSIKYDRVAGFFSPKVLSAAAEGMASFVQNGGKYRLVFSKHLFKEEDYDAIKDGYTKEFEDDFLSCIDELRQSMKDRPRKILGWMIANGHLEIKIAFKTPDNALLHSKWGNFEDNSGNRLNYSGSINETENAWVRQVEYSDVFCSWNEGDKSRVDQKFDLFETIWNNEAPNINVLEFTEVQKNQFRIDNDIENQQQFSEQCELYDSERAEEKENPPLSPYKYQQEAIDAWIDNDYKGIFALATGLGKTFTSLFCVKEYAKLHDSKYLCVIVCPSESLIYQWKSEVEKILDKTPLVLMDESNWSVKLKEEIGSLNNDYEDNLVCLVTYHTYFKPNFTSSIEQCDKNKIIICDEVHNSGAKTWRKGLIDDFDARIALSATPKRHFDDEGSSIIEEYFDGVIIERDLEWGINNGPKEGETFLSPYYYSAKEIDLTEEELVDYRKVTQAMVINYNPNVLLQDDKWMGLANKRAKIIKNAENKLVELKLLLKKLDYNLDGGFIFAGGRKNDEEGSSFFEKVQSILEKNKMKYRRFISDDAKEDRKTVLNQFKSKRLDAILAIDCLDEGIDIPNAETAILLSSSSNSKQYIQRRGRVLRVPKDNKNKIAKIYDFICIPPPAEKKSFFMEQSLIKKQLNRFKEFSDISLNKDENQKLIEKIADNWEIEL